MDRTCKIGTSKFFIPLILILIICQLFTYSPVSATIVKYLSIDELVHQADLIVLGTCERIISAWDREKKNIYTFITVIPQRCLKGGECPPLIRIRQLGGAMDNLAMTIAGSPKFNPNEKVVLFLSRSGDTFYRVIGLSQGKFSVLERGPGEKPYVKRDLNDLTFINRGDTGSQIESRDLSELKVDLEAFITKIESFRGQTNEL